VRLLVASTNAHKLAEVRAVLEPFGIEVLGAEQCERPLPPVDEDQPSFAGNAAKKAVSACEASRLWSLADDSGLEVDALGGAPGVRSARFAGPAADTAANNALLREKLAGVPPERRGASFVCALALARPRWDPAQGRQIVELAWQGEGRARGVILGAPRGSSGFGYDPLFELAEPGQPGAGRTFAEMSSAEKAAVSHRGRALAAFVMMLRRISDSWATSR
jgi:XTP/dITP diphosphohydrolase